MSSLANAIKRKTHKERAQPAARQKYGLLEKHKDYVERARDFHKKEKTIKALKRKAEERNPDEFYFAMQSAKTKDGVHDGSLAKANKYSAEELALMRSQDVGYLALKSRVEAEKVDALRESLHFIGAPATNRHVVFVDEAKEAKAFDPAAYFNTPKELLGRTFNRPKAEALEEAATVAMRAGAKARTQIKKAERRKLAAYRELQQRLERKEKLARTAAHLTLQKEVAGKGRKRKLSKREVEAALGASASASG
eukprot:CAMPEP_0202869552 /NCGR_PEP_ID=MMETSP1391-20130828/12519_1 /ASSEMBLY_ACC=CAM_ASM_000867 /TAXON_ID=1034604 /ORGANISM="Chlamydomonas leiostraca, Strain SAG 11-49" /LENGTH=251 /DNA_ID=CAMNT_0049549887 /DNA_START=127 /DNA_END=879 /DNA_ORIENTATION=+